MTPAYGMIVPLRNEATVLPVVVPKLLEATKGDRVRVVWVCNGCTTGSAAQIRGTAGLGAKVIDLNRPGMTAALQAGVDEPEDLCPRFYLGAGTWLRPGDPAHLMQPRFSGTADLVAPRLRFDTTVASMLSGRIGACWLTLHHGQTSAFSNAIGLSAAA
ncbi:MAG: hypothetical protein ACK4MS_01760 [Paracoccaceae bacterium]